MSNFQYCFVCMDTLERKKKKKMEGTVQICISPIESLFCYFHLASRFWRDQYWYFSGKEIGTCALVELLRILNSFWHNLSQRQGITLQGKNCYYSVNLMGKKKLKWKLEGEWVEVFTPPYFSSSQKGWWVENTGAQKEHFPLMKTVSQPIITMSEGNENASPSILNKNAFFRVVFAFFLFH